MNPLQASIFLCFLWISISKGDISNTTAWNATNSTIDGEVFPSVTSKLIQDFQVITLFKIYRI